MKKNMMAIAVSSVLMAMPAMAESELIMSIELEHQSEGESDLVVDRVEAGFSLDLGSGFNFEYVVEREGGEGEGEGEGEDDDDDDGDFETETAQLTYEFTDDSSISLGRSALAFGVEDDEATEMTTESLTTEISESIAKYIGLQASVGDATYSVFVFEDENTETDLGFGGRVEFEFEPLTLGFSAISSVANSEVFSELEEDDQTAGATLDVGLEFDDTTIRAEVFSVLGELETTKTSPMAYHLEIEQELTSQFSVGASYQATEDAEELEIEKSHASLGVFYQGHEYWRIGLEVYESEEQDGDKENGFVLQFKYEME